MAVVGPSGAGKSSVIRAGVIPALKRSGEGWDAHVVRPGREPLAALAAMLVQLRSNTRPPTAIADASQPVDTAFRANLAPVIERLRAEPGYLGARLRARAASKLRRTLIFVDPFEELYTLGTAQDERAAFLACLAAVADDAASPLRVILSMRSDFLDRLAEDRHLSAEATRGMVLLPPMARDGLREALTRPVESCEFGFEPPALVDRMVDALDATPGALPLLQFTAARLWELRDRDRRLLTEASYEQLGGVAGALASHADAVLAGMPARDARLARAVFLRLVTPERTRGLATLSELRQLVDASERMDRVLALLIDARLLAVEKGVRGAGNVNSLDEAVVEIVHESLTDTWPLLARWLDESEDDAVMLARLRSTAMEWHRSGHAAGLLWTGEAAREARIWHQRHHGELAPTEQRYLAAVFAAAERARRVRQRLFAGILSAAVVVAGAMGWLAWQAAQEAERAGLEARRARDVTRVAAARALPEDPTAQLALLREIEDTSDPPPGAAQEARRLLHAKVAPAVMTGHDYEVMTAAFSPDGKLVVSASMDKTVRVWSADGRGEPLVLRGHDQAVMSAAFSPDGTHIVSASEDTTLRIWSADGRGAPLVLRGHDQAVSSASFSPDGQSIVSASLDGTVRVWNAGRSGAPLVLRGHDGAVYSAAFSPDGQRIASASVDKTVRVWSANGQGEPLVLRGHEAAVRSVAFSPDGKRILSTAWDKTIRVWNGDGSGKPLVIRRPEYRAMSSVFSASFSPDGKRIVSAWWDKTVRVWSVDGRTELLVLRGHDDGIYSASFSPDGKRIVSASRDKTVRVWNADGQSEPLVLRGHDDAVYSASFSPDGRRIVSASRDRTVRVWNANGKGEPLVLRGHGDEVYTAVFSPDGQRIASASWDTTIRVWDANGRGQPLVLNGGDFDIVSASFSPDGQRIVFTAGDMGVRVQNADGHDAPLVLRDHDDKVSSASFSPDGQRILSASLDKTVRVRSADGRGEPLVLRGHDDGISWAEYSPDGRYIVSASRDKSIRIWRADGTGEPIVLLGHALWVNQARFSPDGRRIVSASHDYTVRVWHELTPAPFDDPRLWRATSYCMPIKRRVRILGIAEEQAHRDRQRCLARVEQARLGSEVTLLWGQLAGAVHPVWAGLALRGANEP